MFKRLRGRGIKTRLLNPYDAYWDWKLGVHTFGFVPARGKPDAGDLQLHYTPAPYADIFRLLRIVKLGPDDVFVDLGAGLGRAVFAASWLGARRAIGVEIVEDLCERAEQNGQHSRLANRDIQFFCVDALNYQHRDTTVLFMFHPFGEQTMRQVLRSMETTWAERTAQPLRILYMNPVYDEVLAQSGWLQRVAQVPRLPRFFSTANTYPVSLWQSCARDGNK